jgi:hypothetical protein
VDFTAKKGARRNDHRPGPDGISLSEKNTLRPAVFHDQTRDGSLHEVEPRLPFEKCPHGTPIETAITLCARRPDRRPFRPVEHSELNHGPVRRATHHPAQGIDFTDHRALGNPADRGIAGHLANRLEILRHQQGAGTEACSRVRCLSPGVATSDDDHIVRLHAGEATSGAGEGQSGPLRG